MTQDPMVIVGAGHAGCSAAKALRAHGWTGRIDLLNGEATHPYERPPLSKAVLMGERSISDLSLLNAGWLIDNDVTYRPSSDAVSLSLGDRRVQLSDGTSLQYHKLLVATGSSARRLNVKGTDLRNVHYLRSAVHAEQLRIALLPGTRLVIIGGGLIGLEVAATAAKRGCRVTVVEAGAQLLARILPSEIEPRIRALHHSAGVEIRLNASVQSLAGNGSVSTVVLANGDELTCDVVLISIGAEPRTALARQAGLRISNGIVTDKYLRTSDKNVFAAGDVAFFPDAYAGVWTRLESWKNAEDQGQRAAMNMLGSQASHQAVPWMWSDQYDKVIQVAGHPSAEIGATVRELSDEAAIAFQLGDDGRLISVAGFGDVAFVGRSVRIGQSLIERGIRPDPSALRDSSVDLKSLLRGTVAA